MSRMKKQSGFTLIELMVVMAIIAILATAGLSAYTGYIQKARDATRIADISAINAIILGTLSVSGNPPNLTTLKSAILGANNNQPLMDPLQTSSGAEGKSVCWESNAATSASFPCTYLYQTCTTGQSYRLLVRFESKSNLSLYTAMAAGGGTALPTPGQTAYYYTVGDCNTVGQTADTTNHALMML